MSIYKHGQCCSSSSRVCFRRVELHLSGVNAEAISIHWQGSICWSAAWIRFSRRVISFHGLTFFLDSHPLAEEMRWLQLFTEAYAFGFLAATYYLSERTLERSERLWSLFVYSGLIVSMLATYLARATHPPFSILTFFLE